jgi:hypothetical protein
MGYCRLGLAVVVASSLLIVVKSTPASAGGALALAMMRAGADVATGAVATSPRMNVHFKKTRSYYCYPRNYWWFYRPYTTGLDGHARCMPYFHYPEGPYGRGAKPYVK